MALGDRVRVNSSRIVQLRERDGDCCQLCKQPIDFSITWSRDPQVVSVDHIIPRALHGSNELRNLRLAHQECNIRRGAPGYSPQPSRRRPDPEVSNPLDPNWDSWSASRL